MSGSPFSKDQQLARGERRYSRKVASPKTWQRIADAKQGPCRVTLAPPPNDLAHLIARSQGGPDIEWNIVPLAREAHTLFDHHDPETCLRVWESLTEEEHAGLVAFAGAEAIEFRFGIGNAA